MVLLFLLWLSAIQTKQTLEKVYFYHGRADQIRNRENNSNYNQKTKKLNRQNFNVCSMLLLFVNIYGMQHSVTIK